MSFLSKLFHKQYKIHPVVLISLDGWGLAPPSEGNAITQARTPNMDSFYKRFPHGELIASGESVGLPAGEVGNSEVGHLTMGVGRVIYQSLKRINIAIEKGDFYENKAIVAAIEHAKSNNSNLHIMGLVSSGNVHSNTDHLYALLQTAKKHKFDRVYMHLFTDGRDAPPQDGINVITQVQQKIDLMKIGKIASITGRYYAMDRDGRWQRVKRAYDVITSGTGNRASSAIEAMKASYAEGKTDEFVEPVAINDHDQIHTVQNNDAVIYFNFRVDRARELTMAFVMPDFEKINLLDYGYQPNPNADQVAEGVTTFKRGSALLNVYFVTMTEYQKEVPVSNIAFPPQTNFPDSMSEIISNAGLAQIHLAESEKESMVTYYFRGMSPNPFPNEDIDIVPSPKVATYDLKPEMSAYVVVGEFKKAISKDKYSFVLINFANPDMVAHTGKIKATTKAIEIVDDCLGQVVNEILSLNGTVVVTADHGNAEELLTFPSSTFYYTTKKGVLNTDHSSNPVPVLIISKYLEGQTNISLKGSLSDVAPTLCAIMKLTVPSVMEGRNLLTELEVKQNG